MHAVLSPSSAHRWVNCPGSVQAQQKYPDDENEAAREGTAAHDIAQELIELAAIGSFPEWGLFDGATADNGVMYTQEMFEAAKMYADDVMQAMQKTGIFASELLMIEQPVTIPRVHALNWGTPDCVIWDKKSGVLYVWDFKYGRGVVEVEQNWQLIEYALGVIDTVLKATGDEDQHITVEMRIVQPRAFHIDGPCRKWSVMASDLRGHANQLSVAAGLSQKDNPPVKTGHWCHHCTASRACTALQREGGFIADRIHTLELHDLSPVNVGIEIRYLEQAQLLLTQRLDALTAQSLEQIKAGTPIPGYAIGHGRGSTAWSKPDSEVIMLGDLLGVQLRKPEAPITPTQALKLNVDGAVINEYIEKRQGAARLVTNDKTIAARVFSNN